MSEQKEAAEEQPEEQPEMNIVCSGGITLPPLIIRIGEPDGEQPAGL